MKAGNGQAIGAAAGGIWPARRTFLLLVLVLAGVSGWWLGLRPGALIPATGGMELAGRFLGAALTPALDYESRAGLPEGVVPFWRQVMSAAVETLRVAVTAVSLSLVGGLLLGFLGSSAWWPRRPQLWHRALWTLARAAMTLFRSIHELIWATLFLGAFGLGPLTAVLAIALPYSGTLAKVFAEMCEEASPETGEAYRLLGASPLQFYFLGLSPRVLGELISYALYRFECGLRSAAVLGFLGVPTLGYYIKLSFENSHPHEVWSYLYALLALVLVFDQWSGALRLRLSGHRGPVMAPPPPGEPDVRVSQAAARRLPGRERDPLVLGSLAALAGVILWGWLAAPEAQAPGSLANLQRFLREATPWPVQQGGGWGEAVGWAASLLAGGGWLAVLNTLALSVAAVAGAGLLGWVLLPLAARNLSSAEPFLPALRRPRPWQRLRWGVVTLAARALLIFLRAIPEYIWAFLLLAMLGEPFWAAVLALALHNAGILGRLGAEIVENADAGMPRALRALGAKRLPLLVFGLFPVSLPRFLVYFFYRWETCLREGTVLGLLGVATLGRLIAEGRAMDRYDEMVFYVLLGAALVFAGDVVSLLARRWLRV